MFKQKIITSFFSRHSTLPTIRYQRFLSTDKKESSTNAPELHKDHPSQEIDSSTGDKKKAVNEVPEIRRALASQYKERIQSSRVGRSADASTGAIPTANQRYFLVLTRLFKSPSDIPEYVPNQTMKRMHDRMRVITSMTAVAIVFIIVYSFEWKMGRQIDMDKASGKVVKTYADIKH